MERTFHAERWIEWSASFEVDQPVGYTVDAQAAKEECIGQNARGHCGATPKTVAIDGKERAGQNSTVEGNESQGDFEQLQTCGHTLHENIPSESDAVTEKYEGNGVASEAIDTRNAGLLEAVRSRGERNETAHGKRGRRTTKGLCTPRQMTFRI